MPPLANPKAALTGVDTGAFANRFDSGYYVAPTKCHLREASKNHPLLKTGKLQKTPTKTRFFRERRSDVETISTKFRQPVTALCKIIFRALSITYDKNFNFHIATRFTLTS